MKQVVEVPVEEIQPGMYVAELDRPWLETPFLFQGFEISSQEEIAELRRLCKVVYVDVTTLERTDDPKARRVAGKTAEPPPAQQPHVTQQRLTLDEVSVALATRQFQPRTRDPVPMKTELAQVRVEYDNARRAVAHVLDELRRGRGLDVPHLENVADALAESVCRNREAITWLARMKSKDEYVYTHSLGTSVWALVLGRHLGLDKDCLKSLGLGAMLLDFGKTQIPTALLIKPGKLTPEETAQVRRHVEQGLELVRRAGGMDERVISMIATHHERFDGAGYPNALVGSAIPMVGRIAALVDCYDAMTSTRSYAKPKSTYDAVREFKQLSNQWFQPELVDLFIQAVGVFPTGTLVELNTGEVGVVIGQNAQRRLRPEVMLLLDANKQLRDEFVSVDLEVHERNSAGGAAGPSLWIAKGLEPGAYGVDPTEYFL